MVSGGLHAIRDPTILFTLRLLTIARNDVTYALRVLRRAPGFTVAALVTFALGIGASTSIFTIVDSVLLRPLRLPEPEQLTMLRPSSGSRLSPYYLAEWRMQSE